MAVTSQKPICSTRFALNDGSKLPAVGLGTWQGQYGTSQAQELVASVIRALQIGYRLIDTAQYYGVEPLIGEAIRASGVPRSEITVMTKFWGTYHDEPETALEISLRALNVDYIDVFLMHWPTTMNKDNSPQEYPGQPPYWEVWKKMEKLVGDRCRGIGVCNFTQKTLSRLLQDATISPLVNEVELHALNPCLKLVPYCKEKRIQVVGYSTLGSERHGRLENPILTDPMFKEIAERLNCSTGVLALSWAVQRGVTVIPKSSRAERLDENLRLVRLSEEDVKTINEAHLTLGTMRIADVTEGLIREMPGGRKTILGWTPEDFGWEDENGVWLT